MASASSCLSLPTALPSGVRQRVFKEETENGKEKIIINGIDVKSKSEELTLSYKSK